MKITTEYPAIHYPECNSKCKKDGSSHFLKAPDWVDPSPEALKGNYFNREAEREK
jgi:hypothetical protein